MRRIGVDARDIRSGTYDPVNKDGLPQGHQVKDMTTPHQKEQWGADVRADSLPGREPVLPEGLVRQPQGPPPDRQSRDQLSMASGLELHRRICG
jgi:hypothetical protein